MTPTAQIEVIGRRESLELTAIVDSGFDGELQEVQLMLTESGDALIGTDLLERYQLSIEFPGARVRARRRRGGRRKPSGR